MTDQIIMRIYCSTFTFLLTIITAVAFSASCTTGPDLSNLPKEPKVNKAAEPKEKEISGTYAVNGAGEFGKDPYDGALTVSNQGDTYKFELQTAKFKRTGVGIQYGDAVAVTYADIASGKGCGVWLYKIGSQNNLDGRFVAWGSTKYSTEQASQVEGSNFDGKYRLAGQDLDAKQYTGTLDIKKAVNGYKFSWDTGAKLLGFGMWRGKFAAAAVGGPQCHFALYEIREAGKLDGFTGSLYSYAFGTETAKKP